MDKASIKRRRQKVKRRYNWENYCAFKISSLWLNQYIMTDYWMNFVESPEIPNMRHVYAERGWKIHAATNVKLKYTKQRCRTKLIN